LNEARIKAITGQDPLSARHMRQDFFTFQPRAKLWLATNHKPRVADESYGFWRRVRLIPFAERFVDDHVARPGCVPDHRHADGSLAEALWAEREGILAWAVQGCLAWQKRGLGAPKVVMTGTAEYQAEEDPLGEFIAEVCVLAAECQVQAAQLFKAYTAWAAGLGMRPQEILTARSFSERVRRRFPAEHTRTGTVYRGIGLRAGLAP
jgi:putative DNA primase/helicase